MLGQEINLPAFGKFKAQDKPARAGRNPATGAATEIAAAKKVEFSTAKAEGLGGRLRLLMGEGLGPAPRPLRLRPVV